MRKDRIQNRAFSLPIKGFWRIFLCLTALFALCFCWGCKKKQIDYFSYVSEVRSNILTAQTEDYSLRIYAVEKEYPYSTDGIKRDTSVRTEVYLTAPSGDKTIEITFWVEGVSYGGEMSYDNVKAEYYYSCGLDISALSNVECTLHFGEESLTLCAQSVKTESTLSPRAVLQKLVDAEGEFFASLTDEYGFVGEIYLRLLYEDFPYYYIGIIERNGDITAFLLNGETGKILAKRQP